MVEDYTVDTIELRKAMADKGIVTISKLSDVSGVDRNTTAKVLNGKIRPSSYVIERLAKALDLEPCKAWNIFFKPILRNA